MSEHELDKKALDAALRDARAKGLPEGWTVKLDVRTESVETVFLCRNIVV
jgi:hypothetical protein